MPRVLISDKLEQPGLELLRQAGIELDERHGLKGDPLKEAIQAADGVIVRSSTRITGELLENPGKLRVVVRAGVGVDNIDVAAATRRGILVMNTPGGNTVSTAELTITMLLALARNVPAADASLRSGKWERGKFLGTQVAGKTLGVVGLGRIGREVARRGAGLDMKVIGFDPFLAPDRASQLGIESCPTLDQLLPRCDALTVHTPLNEQTRDLIGPVQLAAMKKGAWVINCARGGIINEAALVEALRSGHLGGAAVDVYDQEPLPADHPFLKLPNVVLTPHLGASTTEAQTSVALEAAQLVIDFLQRGVIGYAVNMAAVDRTELEELRLYVDMARRLGLLHSQMDRGAIRRATITYRGEVARRNTRLITAAFTTGLLETRLDETVNIVNAELFARERGIEVAEQIHPKKGDFSTLIRAEVTTDRKTYTAAATLFGNRLLRLVQLGPYLLDTFMEGIMLVFSHQDVPGLIGYIGTVFGKHQVNIAHMTVGRQVPGGEAVTGLSLSSPSPTRAPGEDSGLVYQIAVLNLDSPPSEEAVAEIQNHPKIKSVSVVKLPPAGEMPVWFG